MNAEPPEAGPCQATTIYPFRFGAPDRSVCCELRSGHEGGHRAEVEQASIPTPAVITWSNPDPPEGVWMVAEAVPFEGITTAIPYASEMDALRAINSGVGYSDRLRAYFVPYGQDLREVLR